MSWYATGTVAVTNNNAAAVGTGTAWVANVQAGDIFWGPDGRGYEVLSVNSNTSLTIGPAYAGATAGGQAYRIAPTQGRVITLTDGVNQLVTQFGGIRDGIGSGNFPDGSSAAPALRFGADSDTGIYRPGNNLLGLVIGGVEVLRAAASNIGIGNNGPPARLTVSAGATGTNPVLGAIDNTVSAYFTNNVFGYGLTVGVAGSGNAWLQSQRSDGNVTTYPILLNPMGGNVGIGVVGSVPAKLTVSNGGAGGIELHVSGGIGGGPYMNVYNRSTSAFMNMTHYALAQTFYAGSGASIRALDIDANGDVYSGLDNQKKLGLAGNRWSVVYAGTGAINTSDGRKKTALRSFTEAELRAAKRIAGSIGVFRFLAGTREHVGTIAQETWAIMADEGLINPIVAGQRPSSSYAFLCYDEWDEVAPTDAIDEVLDDDGNVVIIGRPAEPGREAGNIFGIRPDQLALFVIAAQEVRLAALEDV